MARALALEIQGDGSNFTFDVEGEHDIRAEPTMRENANPPELEELRFYFTVRGARILSSTGTQAQFWTEFVAFWDRLTRDDFPTYVRLVRDPDSAAAVVWTLGPSTYQGLRLEGASSGTDQDWRDASFDVSGTIDIEFSATRVFEDLDGIIGYDQEASTTYDDGGLAIVEWRTTIRTKEGTDAESKAQSLAAIPIDLFGASYTYQTNGPYGVETTILDADERDSTYVGSAAKSTARTPTRVLAVSRVKQWGLEVGTTSAGTSPTRVGYTVRTRWRENEKETTTIASASGPGALAWCRNKAPLNWTSKEENDDQANRAATITWTRLDKSDVSDGDEAGWKISATLTGGYQALELAPVVGFAPVILDGALQPWRATVVVQVDASDPSLEGRNDELKLPGLLPSPWILDRNASEEGAPELVELSATPGGAHKYRRTARLVYLSAQPPTRGSLTQILRESTPVESYYL